MRPALVLLALFTVACSSEGGGADDAFAGSDVAVLDTVADVAETAPFDPGPMPFCEIDEAAIDAWLAEASLRAQVGQHILVAAARVGVSPDSATRAMVEEGLVGAAYVQPPTIATDDGAGLAAFLANLQALAIASSGWPLFVSTDHEGGYNAMINSMTGGTDTLGNAALGAADDQEIAFAQYDLMGRELRALGLNMDFAPAIDTCPSTRNGNLNTRTFGPDPERNARLAVAAVAGLQKNLVVAVAKHFPGDGLADGNPHVEEITVDLDRAALEAGSLRPFQAVIDAGVEAVMTMPARFSALDPERAVLVSRPATTGVLREDMGHERLVVTDAVWMEGADIGLTEDDDLMVEALAAGADILLISGAGPDVVLPIVARLEAAVTAGVLDRDEFDASTRRILRAKQRFCLPRDGARPTQAELETLAERVATEADATLSTTHAVQGSVLLEDDGTALPLVGRVVYAGPSTVILSDPGSTWPNILDSTLGEALEAEGLEVEHVAWTIPLVPNGALTKVKNAIAGADALVLATLQGWFSPDQLQLVEWVLTDPDITLPIVHVSLGVPFDHAQTRGRVAASLALMNARGPALRAAAKILTGAEEAGGALPWAYESLPWEEPYPDDDRCRDEGIDCSGLGICVDHYSLYRCVCATGATATADGLDCVTL